MAETVDTQNGGGVDLEMANIESGTIQNNEGENNEDAEGKEDEKKPGLCGKIMKFIYAAAIISQVLAIILELGSIIVWIAFILGLLLTSYSLYLGKELDQSDSIRELCVKLNTQGDKLKEENEILSKNCDNIQKDVDRMVESKNKLNEIVEEQGANVEELVDLVKSNGEHLKRTNLLLKRKVVHDLTAVVLRSDRDGDYDIEASELDTLTLRLTLVPGLEVNEEKFKEKVKSFGGDINGVFKVIDSIMDEDENDPESIFRYEKDVIQSEMVLE